MPTRLLREGIIDSEAVNRLGWPAEVFYRRLMNAVDDFGRYDARPSVLRSRLYPLKLGAVSEADVSSWLAECERAGLVSRYTANGRECILFHKLGPARAKTSKFPDPPPDLPPTLRADENICAQMQTDENICAQTRAYVPDSDSIVCVSNLPTFSDSDLKSKTRGGGRAREGPSSDEFLAAWNALGDPFPRALRMSDTRSKALKARCSDKFWLENWQAALAQLPQTPFLRGEGGTGWVADVEFFLRPDTVQKIVEGKYVNGPGRGKKPDFREDFNREAQKFLQNGDQS